MNVGLHGVYAIVRLSDMKAYVGSTMRSFNERWSEHEGMLENGTHHNVYLQHAWNESEPGFAFVVLEVTDNTAQMEQYWLDRWQRAMGVFNLGEVIGHTTLGLRWNHTEETKRRMGRLKKGQSLSAEHRRKIGEASRGHTLSKEARCKIGQKAMGNTRGAKPYPTFIHRETGKTIESGVNLTALCKRVGLSPTHMSNVKNGTRKSHKGWVLYSERPQSETTR